MKRIVTCGISCLGRTKKRFLFLVALVGCLNPNSLVDDRYLIELNSRLNYSSDPIAGRLGIKIHQSILNGSSQEFLTISSTDVRSLSERVWLHLSQIVPDYLRYARVEDIAADIKKVLLFDHDYKHGLL